MDSLRIEDLVKLYSVSNLRVTIDTYIERRKRAKENVFAHNFSILMQEYAKIPVWEQILKLNVLFEYLVSNMWFVQNENFSLFEQAVEKKLFEFAEPYCRYHNQALYFLEELYDIKLQIEGQEDSELYVEYIQDRYGTKLLIGSN
jgi:hypothetical protein